MQTHDVEVSIDGVQRVLGRTPGIKQYVTTFNTLSKNAALIQPAAALDSILCTQTFYTALLPLISEPAICRLKIRNMPDERDIPRMAQELAAKCKLINPSKVRVQVIASL